MGDAALEMKVSIVARNTHRLLQRCCMNHPAVAVGVAYARTPLSAAHHDAVHLATAVNTTSSSMRLCVQHVLWVRAQIRLLQSPLA
jgi:hypothetical protein